MVTVLGGGNMFTPAKRLILMGGRPKNEVQYNPATWAEWTIPEGSAGDSTGIVLVTSSISGSITIDTNLKPNTKYGLLYEVVENTTTTTFYAQLGSNHAGTGFSIIIGYQKVITTTPATIGTNYFKIGRNAQADGYIKFKNVRLFELPTGSQIEADFTNLTAAQLNAKYPF